MPNRMVLLGTGTCQLQTHRMASSALIELEDLRLVFDFGRGVANRLAELGLRQDDVEHVVLSHFHPDHLSDLIPYLQAAAWSRIDPRTRDLHVYGPIGLEVQLMRLLSLFGPDNLTRPHYRVRLHEIRGERFTVGGRDFDFCDLPPADNHGLRFAVGGNGRVRFKLQGLVGTRADWTRQLSWTNSNSVPFEIDLQSRPLRAGSSTSFQRY